MKRIRCPRCDEFIKFDETLYEEGQSLIFQCSHCGKQFGIKIGRTKQSSPQEDNTLEKNYGSIIVIENVFHYKQIFNLNLGDNSIGRYTKGSNTKLAILTSDPSIDINHCTINVSKDKSGNLKYILRDGPSNTGTFVDNEILQDKERRIIEDGSLFTIGATSIILKTPTSNE